MQEKKMTSAKKVLLALADYLNVKGIQGLADYFGEDKNKFYAWSKRGKIADTGVILSKCPEIRKEWLETGEGRMSIVSTIEDEILKTGKDPIVEAFTNFFIAMTPEQQDKAIKKLQPKFSSSRKKGKP